MQGELWTWGSGLLEEQHQAMSQHEVYVSVCLDYRYSDRHIGFIHPSPSYCPLSALACSLTESEARFAHEVGVGLGMDVLHHNLETVEATRLGNLNLSFRWLF
jgi:hypothetical protein